MVIRINDSGNIVDEFAGAVSNWQYFPGLGASTYMAAFMRSLLGQEPRRPRRPKARVLEPLPAPRRKEVMEGPLPKEAFDLKVGNEVHLRGYMDAFNGYTDYMKSAGMEALL